MEVLYTVYIVAQIIRRKLPRYLIFILIGVFTFRYTLHKTISLYLFALFYHFKLLNRIQTLPTCT